MKISPINILLNDDFKPNKNFYFISGNESTLMEKIKFLIIDAYQKEGVAQKTDIDSIKNFVDEISLFEDKKIFLCRSCKGVDEESLNNIRKSNNIFIFVQENSQSIKKIKNLFNKHKDCYLIDCYDLEKDSKILILNKFINDNKITISKDVYWLLIEKLENKYIFFENNLKKIQGLGGEIDNYTIRNLLGLNDSGKEKVFFNLFKNNKELVEIYRNKILNNSDVNELYYNSKFYCQMIIDSSDLLEYQKKVPLYLFKEKNYLIELYKKYNSRKKKLLIKLLSSTEKMLRKDSGLSMASGLRFILSVKKISVS